MHQGLRLSRLWLAVVLLAFCLPLFVGLGQTDLETDEAIYSFAVDRILEVGDWLAPKSSPSETSVFLEKPPLKFWIVAAPIRAGLLPHTEFGLRFWDAVAGSAAFLYTFAIGSLLAGPVCGGVAVLLLFVHEPLVFEHGLRTNNMEAMLLLSYCGGVFHVLRWSVIDDERRRRRHALGASLYFVLGFMTKFVAALFLPFTLGLAVLAWPSVRRLFFADRRTWLMSAVLVVGLCAPWFIYAQARHGSLLWETILGESIVRRFTATLIPAHLNPWYYYLNGMWTEFTADRVSWLVIAGVLTLLVQTIRRRWFEAAVVLLWSVVPLAIISSGTSKLYHYAYPFLPPLTLAAGYLVALVMMLVPARVRALLEGAEDVVGRAVPRFADWASTGAVRRAAWALVIVAAAAVVWSLALGGMRIVLDGHTIFKSAGLTRPLVLILLLALATRSGTRVPTLVVALVVFSLMPMAAYRAEISRLPQGKHPIRDAAACLVDLQNRMDHRAGLFLDIPEGIWHPLYYNFRRVQPLTLSTAPLDPAIAKHLYDPASARPLLLSDGVWQEWLRAQGGRLALPGAVAPPMVSFLDTVLLLPGPYAACSPESRLRTMD